MSDIYGTPTSVAKTFPPGLPGYPGRHLPLPFLLNFVCVHSVRTRQNLIIEGDRPRVHRIMFDYAFIDWMDINSFKIRKMFPDKMSDL